MEDRFNREYRYPYVFLNEDPFDDEFKRYAPLTKLNDQVRGSDLLPPGAYRCCRLPKWSLGSYHMIIGMHHHGLMSRRLQILERRWRRTTLSMEVRHRT